jgi:hypothetical protein
VTSFVFRQALPGHGVSVTVSPEAWAVPTGAGDLVPTITEGPVSTASHRHEGRELSLTDPI